MEKKNVLFVCNVNRLRSPTAENIYKNDPDLEVRSAGVDRDATVPVTRALVEWADLIFVMEKSQRNRIHKQFPDLYDKKQIVCLYIPDEYDYMDPGLTRLLTAKLSKYIGLPKSD